MPIVYKIHPGIGFARVGDAPNAFFIGPETPSVGPIEFTAAGEVPLTKFKENDQIKRQGARFRIFAYDKAADGSLGNPREVTANDAEIVWSVHMVNRKAAWTGQVSIPGPRNPGVTGAAREGLVIDAGVKTISGKLAPAIALSGGKFTLPAGSIAVDLGELRTDAAGRLIVLGGAGRSQSIPPNQPVGGDNFADNPDWCDDVGDGPVTATIKVAGGAPVAAEHSAWVIVGPPDYAPNVASIVTLYDRAMQVAIDAFGFPEPTRPSFRDDVQPILARTVSLNWTNDHVLWDSISQDWAELSHGTSQATQQERADIAEALSQPLPLQDRFSGGGSRMLSITVFQKRILQAWALGNFVDDWTMPKAGVRTPLDYDSGPLQFTVGGGFFPGIEAGNRMMMAVSYAEPFRLKSDLPPGHFTEQMALPWQSDFMQCRESSGAPWWPAQRPDIVRLASNPLQSVGWVDGIITMPEGAGAEQQMVDRFAKLGFLRPHTLANGTEVQIEDERDPAFPRAGV